MYYIKQAIAALVYLVFMTVIGFAILVLDESQLVLQVVVCAVSMLLYFYIVAVIAFKQGEEALKVRTANDLEREWMVKSGELRPLKLKEEYKPYKGFITALVASAPLLILLAIHTFVILFINPESVAFGAIAGGMYFVVFSFFRLFDIQLTVYTYYYALIYLPLIFACIGIPYILGAKKIERQQEKIKETQKLIYGDKN